MIPVVDEVTLVNAAAANALFAYDAVVIQDATPSGRIYPTVDAAIDAGAKSIFVAPGEYAGFTADEPSLLVVGGGASGYAATGARFTSTVTISALDVQLENLAALNTASGSGFYLTGGTWPGLGARARLINCHAYGCASHGVEDYTVDTLVLGGSYHNNAGAGYRCDRTLDVNARLIGAKFGYNGTYGIHLVGPSSAQGSREVMIGNCYIDNNVGHGVMIGGDMRLVSITGCVIMDHGGSAYGIYVHDDIRYKIGVSGCVFHNNKGGTAHIFDGRGYIRPLITSTASFEAAGNTLESPATP